MDDELFIADLFTNELLSGDLKSEIRSLSTSASKATRFLDCVIKPAISTNNGYRILNKLLTVMKNSGNDYVILLAENIHSMLNTILHGKTGFIT